MIFGEQKEHSINNRIYCLLFGGGDMKCTNFFKKVITKKDIFSTPPVPKRITFRGYNTTCSGPYP